ncbi:hypothetical protein ACFVT1_05950 [Streptomyces sp. NPDC057963]|uniref:hypothetical protein n=1 Tax=Streptomyces sp. NPDC057963 TaxID=3346290 RepID=UPI0036E1ABB1
MTDDGWVGEYAFPPEDGAGYPKTVRDEVKAVAVQIVGLANLGIHPAGLGDPTPGTARRHMLASGGRFETRALPRTGPRLLAAVLVVPPLHLP